MEPGEAIISGQVDGRQLGNAIFQFLPCMPHEGPPGVPRALAKRLFPQGFIRPVVPTYQPTPAATLIPSVGIPAAQPVAAPAAPQPAAVQVNQARPQPAQQPAPQGYRPVQSGGNPIQAVSQRVRIAERGRGL